MKSISAAIIALAGAILLSSGAHIQHHDTQAFFVIVGSAVGLLGLWGWFVSFREK